MWEIRCIVGEKKALEVMKLLKGSTLEPPVMVHIDDGLTNGAIHHTPKSKSPEPGGGSTELLARYAANQKTVTSRALREHCEANGFSKNGYSYALKRLVEKGLLKKTKTPHLYEVTR